jgi:hypothetical protein
MGSTSLARLFQSTDQEIWCEGHFVLHDWSEWNDLVEKTFHLLRLIHRHTFVERQALVTYPSKCLPWWCFRQNRQPCNKISRYATSYFNLGGVLHALIEFYVAVLIPTCQKFCLFAEVTIYMEVYNTLEHHSIVFINFIRHQIYKLVFCLPLCVFNFMQNVACVSVQGFLWKTFWIISLGPFAKLGKATISFVMSVRPILRMEQRSSHWTDFHEIWHVDFFENLFHYNWTKTTGTSLEDQYTFLILSRSLLHRMKNILNKSCREIRNTHLMFNNVFCK